MNRIVLLLLAFACGIAQAQTSVRIRGTITGLDGDMLAVKSRDGKDLKLQLAPDAAVATAKAAKLAELNGKYVGSAAMQKDGRLVAMEVHTLGPQVPAGHTPWDLQPGSTMTNANLTGLAQVTGGNEITMSYQGGTQRIFVPDGTPVVTTTPGGRSDLKPGEYVFVAARQEGDGKLTALRLQVSKDGVRPPQ